MAKEANKVNDVRDLIISEWIRNPNASIIFFADSMADLSTGGGGSGSRSNSRGSSKVKKIVTSLNCIEILDGMKEYHMLNTHRLLDFLLDSLLVAGSDWVYRKL